MFLTYRKDMISSFYESSLTIHAVQPVVTDVASRDNWEPTVDIIELISSGSSCPQRPYRITSAASRHYAAFVFLQPALHNCVIFAKACCARASFLFPFSPGSSNLTPFSSHNDDMDIANQLFSLTLGVEPNRQTLQNLAGTLNSAGKSTLSRFPRTNLICFFIGSTIPLRETASSIAVCGYGRSPEICRTGTYPKSTATIHPSTNQIHRSRSYSASRQSTQSEDIKKSSSMASDRKAAEGAAMEAEAASSSPKGGAGEEAASKGEETTSAKIRSVQGSSPQG